jgi:ribose/xylose/arabinose/galactoside ABC-type transport system permease subunit
MTAITRQGTLGHWLTRNGFLLIVVALFLFFSIVTQHFASVANVLAMAHTMAPLVIIASGLALVVFTGKLDISVGSIAFLSSAIAVLLMHDAGVGAPLAFLAALVTGALLGALNGFVVVVLGINPLIATLGSMIALRGVALQLTNAILIPLPESVRGLGNATIGGVFIDVIIAAVILVVVHVLHRRTVFGRRLDAIGNGEDNAVRIGIPVPQTVLLSFIASGFLASVGGLIGLLQVGAISAYLGKGMEFTAVAAIVVGGVSLFGGRGTILPGVLLGAFAFTMIANGLNQMSADPYAYKLVTGGLIFIAMYVDALRTRRLRRIPIRPPAQAAS